MATLTYTGDLTIVTCHCGLRHAIPSELHKAQLADPARVAYCPLGHTYVHRKSEASKLREQLQAKDDELARERARRDQAEADARHERRRANGYKGAAAKTKKRAAKGVCPAPGCKRSFVDVARHVATCHPSLEATVDA